jgi:predicted PhzF superfamily epimerase YddE/YHI9
VWPAAGGEPRQAGIVVQECGIGLVCIRRAADSLAFAAPTLLRSGPVDDGLVDQIAAVLRIDRSDIVDAEWADNGPGWVVVMLESADAVIALEPASSYGARCRAGAAASRVPRWAEDASGMVTRPRVHCGRVAFCGYGVTGRSCVALLEGSSS